MIATGRNSLWQHLTAILAYAYGLSDDCSHHGIRAACVLLLGIHAQYSDARLRPGTFCRRC